MPFEADTRCPYMRVEFNTSYIAELLEDLLEMDFIEHHTYFDEYLENIEDDFSIQYCKNPTLNFNDWFLDNYDSNTLYDYVLEECFVKRE